MRERTFIFWAWLMAMVAIVCGCAPSQPSHGGGSDAGAHLVGAANVPIPSPGDAGYVLTSQGKGATPAWLPPADGGALAPGTAGQALYTNDEGAATIWVTNSGDFTCSTSTPGNCTVDGLQTRAVSTTAPSVGNSLIWDGGTWGPSGVNLAGGSNSVTGNLPVGNFSPGTSPQVLMTTTGPATAWETISQDVTLGATGVATVNSISGAAPVNVTNSVLSFGSTVAASGDLRFPNNVTIVAARNALNSADIPIIRTDSSNDVLISGSNGAGLLGYGAGQNVLNLDEASTDFITGGGSALAGTGFLRMPNNSTIVAARNAANSADIPVLRTDSSNDVLIGGSNQGGLLGYEQGTNVLSLDGASSDFIDMGATPGTNGHLRCNGGDDCVDSPGAAVIGGTSATQVQVGGTATDGQIYVNANNSHGMFEFTDGATPQVIFGNYGIGGGSTSFATIYFLSSVASLGNSNWGFLGNQSDTYLNAPTGTIHYSVGGIVKMSMTSADLSPQSAGGMTFGSVEPWGAAYFGAGNGGYTKYGAVSGTRDATVAQDNITAWDPENLSTSDTATLHTISSYTLAASHHGVLVQSFATARMTSATGSTPWTGGADFTTYAECVFKCFATATNTWTCNTATYPIWDGTTGSQSGTQLLTCGISHTSLTVSVQWEAASATTAPNLAWDVNTLWIDN